MIVCTKPCLVNTSSLSVVAIVDMPDERNKCCATILKKVWIMLLATDCTMEVN